MKAWCITESGGPDVLKCVDQPDPTPGPQDILVNVRAVGLNRADLLQRMGLYPAPPGAISDVPGLEFAGEIAAVGPAVQGYKAGDRVMGLIGGGAYAEKLVVHERETIPVPEGMDWAQAGATPEAFLTAYRAIFLEGGLQPGQWCLVRAATSGIGLAAVQLVRAFAGFSLGTSRNRERLEKVKPHGLDVALVDGEGELPKEVMRHTGLGAHVILDLVGGNGHLNENLQCLRPEGRQIVVGLMAGRDDQVNMGLMLGKRATVRAMTMRSLPQERRMEMAQLFLDRLLPHFQRGNLKPVVDTVLPFDQAPEAHRLMEQGSHTGKIVLTT
ncbi:MAG: NAD(P)H-quinone oxidoreductase [Ectothiorhodospiraceae bacterium]|nr:NAD(P)H-quinone oxidoreductase [Ectothiorhodospiraceae bacterium]